MSVFRRVTPVSMCALIAACGNGDDPESDVAMQAQRIVIDDGERPGRAVIISQEEGGEPVGVEMEVVDEGTAPISDEEYAAWEELQAAQGLEPGDDSDAQPSDTELALKIAAESAPDELIPIYIALVEPTFDFERFAEAKALPEDQADAARRTLVAERQRQVADAGQSLVLERLGQLGATIDTHFWLTNSLAAHVPAKLVATVASWSEVTSIQYLDPSIQTISDSTGENIRDETFVGNLLDDGFDGDGGGRLGGKVRVGVIEAQNYNVAGVPTANRVRYNHNVFLDAAGGSSRFTAVYDCLPNCAGTAVNGTGDEHGTRVAWVAGGSIIGGIDPGLPGANTSAQQQRSGIATASQLYYYRVSGSLGYTNALQQAINDGVDIVNASLGFTADVGGVTHDIECGDATVVANPITYDQNGLNAKITLAMSSGTLLTHSAGNSHNAGDSCSIKWPAWRPEVLTAAGASTLRPATLDSACMLPYSSRGRSLIGTENGAGTAWWHDSVVLTAGGVIERYPTSAGYAATGTSVEGTSYAAPQLAGSAALLLDQFSTVAGMPSWATTPRHIFTNMLLMGDGWWSSWTNLDDDCGLEPTVGSEEASPSSGFGKLKMHYPSSGDPTMGSSSSWKWKVWDSSVTQGTDKWWPANPNSGGTNVAFPANVTQFKWAFTYFPTNMNDYGSMGVELYETPTCTTANPTTGTLLAYDWSGGTSRARLQLFGSDVAGKCLWLVIRPYQTPGASVAVQMATYYHSGTATPNH